MISKIKSLFIIKANEGYLSEQYVGDVLEVVFRNDLKRVKVFETLADAEIFLKKNNFEDCKILAYGLIK